MTGSTILYFGLLFAFGAILGAFFFGGLWLTVRHLPNSRHPALLFLGSVLIRTAAVLSGIWFASNGMAGAILACLAGFLTVRLLSTSSIVSQRVIDGQRGSQ